MKRKKKQKKTDGLFSCLGELTELVWSPVHKSMNPDAHTTVKFERQFITL